MNHNGIDQGFADGTSVVPAHTGSLVETGRHPEYGFYAMYQVTPELRVSYHQLRDAGRGARSLSPGNTSVGLVGNPLVKTAVALRPTFTNWSGATAGLSDRSGPHVHTQCWRLVKGRWIPVDPDSAWVAGQLTTTTPAGGSGTPITEDVMNKDQEASLNRVKQILESLETYLVGGGRGQQADDRVLGVLRSRTHEDGKTTAYVLDELDGAQLRKDIGGSTTRAVAETSAAFHQLVALITKGGGATVSAAEIAAELHGLLGDAIAGDVANELAERLKS